MSRRRRPPYDYVALCATLLLLITVPATTATKVRGAVVATLAPSWTLISRSGHTLSQMMAWAGSGFAKWQEDDSLAQSELTLENQQLRTLVNYLQETAEQQATLLQSDIDISADLLHYLENPLPARVVYRPVESWNHYLWIDRGWEHNQSERAPRLAKESPVVVGDAIVGIVDYVGRRYSRVRLLSDPGLIPSVRVARGRPQDLMLLRLVDELLDNVNGRADLLEESPEARLSLLAGLETLKAALVESDATAFLAKGELHGTKSPLWSNRLPPLRGSGFNYDFPDEAGPARDLRSGVPTGEKAADPITLIQPHDLLVTTGMDGIFPPGLQVATVTKVEELREGAYCYDITAQPVVQQLDVLTTLFVLSPYFTPLDAALPR